VCVCVRAVFFDVHHHSDEYANVEPSFNELWVIGKRLFNLRYCHIDFPAQGTEESPPREGSPMDLSPKDQGLGGVVLGDSAGFGLGGALVEFGLEAAYKEGDGAPPA
jgi:hypothetical protein